jgi:hypothetical protein
MHILMHIYVLYAMLNNIFTHLEIAIQVLKPLLFCFLKTFPCCLIITRVFLSHARHVENLKDPSSCFTHWLRATPPETKTSHQMLGIIATLH